jgi:putative methionine-R-sulfoxide reductase with GAF domain
VKTYRSAREVLGAVEQVLAPQSRLASRGRLPLKEIRGAKVTASPLTQVAKLLQGSRKYFAVTIFLAAGDRLLRVASAGPAPRCDSTRMGEGNVGEAAKTGAAKIVPDVSLDSRYIKVFDETRSELVRPIKIAAHVIGVIDVESDRVNGFAYQDGVLLQKIAAMLAKFLSGRGKYLVMKARETALAIPQVPPKHPQTERQQPMRAAAGEKSRS